MNDKDSKLLNDAAGRSDGTLQPEDYMEPRCVLCDEPYGAAPQVKPVPQQRIIRKIVGHKGQGVTETVYTHLELPVKLEAINKI